MLLLVIAGCGQPEAPAPSNASDSAPAPILPTPASEPGDALLTEADLLFFSEKPDSGVLTWTGPHSFQLTGEGRGYAYTRETYGNFTLRAEFRWLDSESIPEEQRPDANTGILVFVEPPHRTWPPCLEVQGKWSEMGLIKTNVRDGIIATQDQPTARETARKPIGEWNELVIVARDGALHSELNGTPIANSEPTDLLEGVIGFQLERYGVEFRNIAIESEQ